VISEDTKRIERNITESKDKITDLPLKTPIKFGIFDWIDHNQLALPDLYEQRLKLIECAEEKGFYCYHIAEHHGSPLNMTPSPGIFLAAAAQRTERIRLGTLVYVLPAYNPLRLIEEICMLDNLSRGRLDVGVGRGISPIEMSFFNIDVQQSRDMFREALDALVSALVTGKLSYQGRYFSFNDVELKIEPFQRPYPPLWYPTNSSDSMNWLAKEGFNTVVHYQSMPVIRELFDLYKRVQEEHRLDKNRLNAHVSEPLYGISRHVYVGETDTKAWEDAKAALAQFNENTGYLQSKIGDNRRKEYLNDFEARRFEGLYIAGAPDTVREEVKKHMEITGSNYFVGSFCFGNLTTEQAMNSLRLFAEEVMPAFKASSTER
jgi:alkanesulfonate monooxygenase SsuD/methylene tetrahydromethanopterin reductase-like flavin-dependent oxidoreductase (luciferase family)